LLIITHINISTIITNQLTRSPALPTYFPNSTHHPNPTITMQFTTLFVAALSAFGLVAAQTTAASSSSTAINFSSITAIFVSLPLPVTTHHLYQSH
jgi:hypothetical protein